MQVQLKCISLLWYLNIILTTISPVLKQKWISFIFQSAVLKKRKAS